MRMIVRTLMGLSLIAVVAGPAAAQGPGGRGGFGRGGGGLAMLLGNASVQKELKLSDEQITKAKELADSIGNEAREKMQDLSQEERREKMPAINAELNEKLVKSAGEFLKPEQITRLKQISYHARGASVFSDPEVAKKLGLTDAQRSEIKSFVDDSQAEMRTIFQENQDDRETAMKKIGELRKSVLAKVEAKLNDEQQKTWKEMLGSPFEVKYEPRPQ